MHCSSRPFCFNYFLFRDATTETEKRIYLCCGDRACFNYQIGAGALIYADELVPCLSQPRLSHDRSSASHEDVDYIHVLHVFSYILLIVPFANVDRSDLVRDEKKNH